MTDYLKRQEFYKHARQLLQDRAEIAVKARIEAQEKERKIDRAIAFLDSIKPVSDIIYFVQNPAVVVSIRHYKIGGKRVLVTITENTDEEPEDCYVLFTDLHEKQVIYAGKLFVISNSMESYFYHAIQDYVNFKLNSMGDDE